MTKRESIVTMPAYCKSLRGDRDGRFPRASGPARLVGECSAGEMVGTWTVERIEHDHGCRMIADVAEGSAAATAGLREGDIVTAIGATKIDDVKQLHESIAKWGDQTLEVMVVRDGQRKRLRAALIDGSLGVRLACSRAS